MRYSHDEMLPERAFQPRAKGPFGHCLGMTREGGKGGGGSAPSPDPNIGRAQMELASLAKEQWSTFQSQIWPELQRVTNMQEGRANEQWALDKSVQEKQMKVADEEYARLKDKFYPLQDQMIADAENYNTAGERERQAALAMGDVRDQMAQTRANSRMDARSYGIDPTSGRYAGMDRAVDVSEAALSAAASTRARTAAEQLGWAKRMDAIGLGMGTFGNQATSTGLALNAGNAALNSGQTTMGNYTSMGGSLNSAAGTSMQGWNQVGGLGVGKYNADVSAYNARQQAGSQSAAGFGQMVGTGIGVAAKLGVFSDRRMKENIHRLGTLEKWGIGVYSFEYKDEFKDLCGHGTKLGVMADEVEAVLPEAVVEMDNGYKAVNYDLVLE